MADYKQLSELRNWKDNPRGIKQDRFDELKSRIQEYGEIKPLIVTTDGEVLGGNMRLKAMQELGFDKAWVSIVNPKTDADKIKIALTDNEEMGYYEDQALAELIEKYKDDIDLTKYSVHLNDPISLEELLQKFGPEPEEDEVPEVSQEEPISVLGEVYQLGRHRVMCGDSTKIEDVEKLMDGKKADMVFTDPPYGMDLDAEGFDKMPTAKGTTHKSYSNVIGDSMDFNPDFINNIFSLFGYCEEMFLWGGDYYSELLVNKNDGSWVVWDKRQEGGTDKLFGSSFELCWSKSKHKREIARVLWAGYFGMSGEDTKTRMHPTQKPVKLADWFFSRYGKDNDVVIDLFLGSGSTLIACEQTNRICYGMELDCRYLDVIRRRYHKFVTGSEDGWQEGTPIIGK
jgi:DNA modification methylase